MGGVIVMVGFLVGAYALLGRAARPKPQRRISLKPSASDSASSPQRTDKLRIAVGAIISPAESLIFYEDIFDYIG